VANLSALLSMMLASKSNGVRATCIIFCVRLTKDYRHVSDLIDWTIDQNSKHWRRVVDYAIGRATVHKQVFPPPLNLPPRTRDDIFGLAE